MNQIERSFAELQGQLCWGEGADTGRFSRSSSDRPASSYGSHGHPCAAHRRVHRLLARRSVRVRGRWHLWIYCCDWLVRSNGVVVGDSSTSRRIDRAARELDGQKLIEVIVNPRGARTRFVFDWSRPRNQPFDRSSEQWLLFEPNGNVLSWRADRKYRYGPGNRLPGLERWRSRPR